MKSSEIFYLRMVNLTAKFEGNPLDWGIQIRVRWFSTSFAALYFGNGAPCKISKQFLLANKEPRLQLNTNRQSYTGF